MCRTGLSRSNTPAQSSARKARTTQLIGGRTYSLVCPGLPTVESIKRAGLGWAEHAAAEINTQTITDILYTTLPYHTPTLSLHHTTLLQGNGAERTSKDRLIDRRSCNFTRRSSRRMKCDHRIPSVYVRPHLYTKYSPLQ